MKKFLKSTVIPMKAKEVGMAELATRAADFETRPVAGGKSLAGLETVNSRIITDKLIQGKRYRFYTLMQL